MKIRMHTSSTDDLQSGKLSPPYLTKRTLCKKKMFCIDVSQTVIKICNQFPPNPSSPIKLTDDTNRNPKTFKGPRLRKACLEL